MVLEVVKYGSGVLREKAHRVPLVTDDLRALVSDMMDTMHAAKGVGLAAEQIGRTESVCVIDVPPGCEDDKSVEEFNAAQVQMPLVMFNPEIVATAGEQSGSEGCLSFPSVGGTVTRPAEVTFQYQDADGRAQMATAKGFLARAVMHETDHLAGVLYVDRMNDSERASVAGRLEKLIKKQKKEKRR